MIYLTKKDDQLDDVCYRYYGDSSTSLVDAVLEANRGLAALCPLIPAGVSIELPEVKKIAPPTTTRLWE